MVKTSAGTTCYENPNIYTPEESSQWTLSLVKWSPLVIWNTINAEVTRVYICKYTY